MHAAIQFEPMFNSSVPLHPLHIPNDTVHSSRVGAVAELQTAVGWVPHSNRSRITLQYMIPEEYRGFHDQCIL
jgi:hypothetical protein